MIILLPFMVLMGDSLCLATEEEPLEEPTPIIPYPIKQLPIPVETGEEIILSPEEAGQLQKCFILSEEREKINKWTSQEIYVNSVWTDQEKWVWNQLCLGKKADLQEYPQSDKCKTEKKCKITTPGFLKTILLREPFRSALPEKVVIKNATFSKEIDLSSTRIDKELHFVGSTFEERVNFSNTEIFQSLYLEESKFKKTLRLDNSIIQGNLVLREAEIDLDSKFINEWLSHVNQVKDKVILNLRRIDVKGDINFKEIKLKFKQNKPEKKIISKDFGLKPLGLLGAKIGGALNLNNSNFDVESKLKCWCKSLEKESSKKPCGQVEIIAVTIGDAIIYNDGTKFNQLNLRNSQINRLLIETTQYESLKDIKSLPIIKKNVEIPKDISRILSENNIDMESVNVNLFNITTTRENQENNEISDDSVLEKPTETKQDNTISSNKYCKLNLHGFIYQQINTSAFNLIVACLKAQYDQASINDRVSTNKESSTNEQLSKLEKYNQLLQPFEQAAKTAKELGQYPIERELLYMRRKLDLEIAKESINDGLFIEYIDLQISDWIYGFGYKRLRVLWFFSFFLIIGIIVCCWEIRRKQIELIDNIVNSRNQELEDEKVEIKGEIGNGCAGIIEFEELLPYIDSINKIVFQGKIYDNNTRESSIYVTFKDIDLQKEFGSKVAADKDYLKIPLGREWHKNIVPAKWSILVKVQHFIAKTLNRKSQTAISSDKDKIKYLINALSSRAPDNIKVGFCENLFPRSGLWLVYEKLEAKNKNKKHLKYELYCLNENKEFTNCSTFLLRRKRAGISFIYSLDLLLAIIQLDEELYDFIFQDSKGMAKLYFIFLKIFAIIFATVLLPITLIS